MYAPEHLIINVKDAEKWESFIENAGNNKQASCSSTVGAFCVCLCSAIS
jgi:histidinol dehydrogenase